jgi:hypothetical protein
VAPRSAFERADADAAGAGWATCFTLWLPRADLLRPPTPEGSVPRWSTTRSMVSDTRDIVLSRSPNGGAGQRVNRTGGGPAHPSRSRSVNSGHSADWTVSSCVDQRGDRRGRLSDSPATLEPVAEQGRDPIETGGTASKRTDRTAIPFRSIDRVGERAERGTWNVERGTPAHPVQRLVSAMRGRLRRMIRRRLRFMLDPVAARQVLGSFEA